MEECDKKEVIRMMRGFYASEAVHTNGSEEVFNNDVNACVSDNPFASGYVFIREDGSICGYSMLAHSYSTEYGRPVIWIEDLFLEEDVRGNGLAVELFDLVKEKYPDLPEEKKKEVYEKTKAQIMNISGEARGIPRYPVVGKLPDYEFHGKFSILSMKFIGKERRIVGTETIQTEAGSFDCVILEETITTKVFLMKEVEKIKAWYAYGIGLVKEITYDKSGKLISTMTLNAIMPSGTDKTVE
jgi:GNAT superfamily N-acetyltransferase